MISDGLLFTISYGIGDPTVDGRLPPASAVDANLDLARERAFRNFAVEGRTRQTGTCEHGFDTDDPFEIGQASDSSVWLSQAEMAELFQTTKQSISLHVRNILDEGELEEEATVKENRSEEHTTELQSLLRNSYAVFCLKKKKQKQNIQHT